MALKVDHGRGGPYEDQRQGRLRRPRRRRARLGRVRSRSRARSIAEAQNIPLQFLEHILLELKHARLVRARRGARGGYWLAKPPEEIRLADVIRAVEGPLANIQDLAPEATKYPGNSERLSRGLDRRPRLPPPRAGERHASPTCATATSRPRSSR